VKSIPCWISLFAYCLLAAFTTALVFAILVAGGAVALANHEEGSSDRSHSSAPLVGDQALGTRFTGMITDSRCGARHMRNSQLSTTECTEACVRNGAHYVLIDGDRRYLLIGAEQSLSKLAGERANIMGTLQGNAIVVNSAAALF
jgi:hypothetical protein